MLWLTQDIIPIILGMPEIQVISLTIKEKLKNNRFKSTKFASTLTSRVKSKTPLLNNPLRSAGFAVLKSDEFPSVLVELGFVTNEFDRKNLRSGNWLQTISSQFVSAINEYFK